MQVKMAHKCRSRSRCASARWKIPGLILVRFLACSAALIVLFGAAAAAQQPPVQPNPDKSIHDPVLTAAPDANAQMAMRDQQTKQQNFAAANAERRKQIADDSTRLLKLATDLKAEVDNTSKDTLSLNVIRRADEIERLAHSVKEKMKLTVGAN
jgi:hypothetical protein